MNKIIYKGRPFKQKEKITKKVVFYTAYSDSQNEPVKLGLFL